MKKQQPKKQNLFKQLFAVVLFISIIAQANIFITEKIKIEVKKQEIKKQALLCPPDICTYTSEDYDLPNLPPLEELDIEFEPIK